MATTREALPTTVAGPVAIRIALRHVARARARAALGATSVVKPCEPVPGVDFAGTDRVGKRVGLSFGGRRP